MNLYTLGKGLYGTHVTWEDIEEDMQRELETVASFGPNKTAKNIGDGKGFMSRILLIDPDWQRKDKNLPERFVVKILTQLAMQTLTKQISEKNGVENVFSKEDFMAAFERKQKRCHNVEVALYRHMQKIPPTKFPSPKIYYMRKFSESNPAKGYIIMEYMEDFKIINIYENVPLEAVKEALHALAVMESVSLKLSTAEKDEFTEKFFEELYGEFLNGEKLNATIKSLRVSADNRLEKKIGKVEGYLKDITDVVRADQLADEMGMERVICHGDLWSANLLWKQHAPDDIHLSALIDFQTAHMGCPAGDLVRLLSSCLSGRDRQQHWEELLEEFYDYLEEEIGDGKMPYTLKQLKESYKQFIPLGSFLVLSIIQPIYETTCKRSDEEQKEKILEGIVEKMEYLLDDIIFYHERNLKRRREKHS